MANPKFDLTYNILPSQLHSEALADESPNAKYVWQNDNLANEIALTSHWLGSDEALDFFSGNSQITTHKPLAMAYSGHQFGHFNPKLGDGRALLIAEYLDNKNNRYDVHLKGSGATVYSRRGDGKSTLRAALKEVLFSEYLAALNIPTTRALAVFETGEIVQREEKHKGAVLVRLAKSLVRVGTFQYAYLVKEVNAVKQLADFLIAREYSDINLNNSDKYQKLLTKIISRQASLIASWMSHGFIHGVMNTDNMALSGETIDFGPCAFMERFKANQVFSSIDENGRYAWNAQAEIAAWNLTRLAETFLPLLDEDQEQAIDLAEQQLNQFNAQFLNQFVGQIMQKLGLSLSGDEASDFMNQTFAMLNNTKPDFTLFFRYLSHYLRNQDISKLNNLCQDHSALDAWLTQWKKHIKNENSNPTELANEMDKINPIYVPRFHLVEHALNQASKGDISAFNHLLSALQSPMSEQNKFIDLLNPAADSQTDETTFCET